MSMEDTAIALPPALEALQQWAASERVSGVTLVDQARIDAFADATGDHNWIHVDPGRAQAQLPGGQTIAQASCCSRSPCRTMWPPSLASPASTTCSTTA